LLADPQTSGGLRVSGAAERAAEVVQSINAAGYKSARVIGEAVPGAPKIEVVA
jgi:selenide, water dikinase